MDFYKQINSLLKARQIDEAFNIIEGMPETSINQKIIKTNYFCLMNIHNNYQIHKSINLLEECLTQKQITRIAALFTKINIGLGYRKMQLENEQFNLLNQIINDHFGQYFILKNLAHKNQNQILLLKDYIFLLTISLERIIEICVKKSWTQKQEQFRKACLKMKKHQTTLQQNTNKQNEAFLQYQKKVELPPKKQKSQSQSTKTLGQKCMNI